MKLIELNVTGFGKLVRQNYKFSPGLNLVYGLNEAGKSTLQRSIFALLYGFFEDGSIKASMRVDFNKFQPWDKDAKYAGMLSYELDNGNKYQVIRVFEPQIKTGLTDLKNGKDITTSFRSNTHGRVFFADKQLGINLSVFENTCFIRQTDLIALDKNAGEITDTLLKLIASASNEGTANQAAIVIEVAIKEQIGGAQAKIKPLPVALSQLDKFERERDEAKSSRQLLISQTIELNSVTSEMDNQIKEIDRVQYLQLLADRDQATKQKEAVDNSENEVHRWENEMAQLTSWSNFPARLDPVIQELSARRNQLLSNDQKLKTRAVQAINRLPAWEQSSRLLFEEIPHKSSKTSIDPSSLTSTEISRSAIPVISQWLITQISHVRFDLGEDKSFLENERVSLSILIKINRTGLTTYHQELRDARIRLEREVNALEKATINWSQLGISEEEWKNAEKSYTEEVQKWESWATFPINKRDDIFRLTSRREDLKSKIKNLSENATNSQIEYDKQQTQIRELEKSIQGLDSFRSLPDDRLSSIQEQIAHLSGLKEISSKAQARYPEAQTTQENLAQIYKREFKEIIDAVKTGIPGLMALQQHWLYAQQSYNTAQEKFKGAEEEWSRVNMTASKFADLERTVKEIQSGERPSPKPRKGCSSILAKINFWRKVPVSTPTEIILYSEIKPIWERMVSRNDEVRISEKALINSENEIREGFGLSSGEIIEEKIIESIIQRVQAFQQSENNLKQQNGLVNSLHDEAIDAQDQYQKKLDEVKKEFYELGFNESSPEEALDAYRNACNQKQKLVQVEAEIEHLHNKASPLLSEINGYRHLGEELQETDKFIIEQLQLAHIQVNDVPLENSIREFEIGIENFQLWENAKSRKSDFTNKTQHLRDTLFHAQRQVEDEREKLLEVKQKIARNIGSLTVDQVEESLLSRYEIQLEEFYAHDNKLQEWNGRLDRLETQADEIKQILNDWEISAQDIINVELEIKTTLQQAKINISEISIEEGIKAFQEGMEKYHLWQKAGEAHKISLNQYQSLIGNLSESTENHAQLEIRINDLLAKNPEWKSLTPKETSQFYEMANQKLNAAYNKKHEDALRLEQDIKRLESSHRLIAEIDEDIAASRFEVKRLKNFQKSLELAKTELISATQEFQKQFAPRLEKLMSEGLSATTQNRYSTVSVDPTSLAVRIVSPERNSLIGTDLLSAGTRDLIYLILRMGIARMMSASGEKLPLLLDDPFIQFDQPRLKMSLNYINQIAKENQIILFSKDETVRDWFNLECKNRPENRFHTLSKS